METIWVSIAKTNEYPEEGKVIWFYNEDEYNNTGIVYLGFCGIVYNPYTYHWIIINEKSDTKINKDGNIISSYGGRTFTPTHWCYAYIPEIKEAK